MSDRQQKRVGILAGRETEWPAAFAAAVNRQAADVRAEMVTLGGTRLDSAVEYDLIFDRISHEIPYYRSFLQFAMVQGCYVINNPFVWSLDNRFVGTVLARRMGLRTPRTVALPNKEIEQDLGPESFRNLSYPMDWEGIIAYVGVPAVFKDVRSGGRRQVRRVQSVADLIRHFDESGTQTMVLQEVIESDTHLHCFVVGPDQALLLQFDQADGRYLAEAPEASDLARSLIASARRLSQAYRYDFNMVEFVLAPDGPVVINSTNPAPLINRALLSAAQFDWLVAATAGLAVARVRRPPPQPALMAMDL